MDPGSANVKYLNVETTDLCVGARSGMENR